MLISSLLERAIYIDFEGLRDEVPVLLGIREHGKDVLSSLDYRLDAMVFSTNGRIEDMHGCLDCLAKKVSEGNVIAGFSEHEARIFEEQGYPHLARTYVNLRPLFCRAFAHGSRGPNTLRRLEHMAGYWRHLDTPAFGVAPILRQTMYHCNGRRFSDVGPVYQQDWVQLANHNFHDCASLEWMLEKTRQLGYAVVPPACFRQGCCHVRL